MTPFGPPGGGYGNPYGMPDGAGVPGPSPAHIPGMPPQMHTLAIISLVTGVLLCVPGTGLPAVICGFMARGAISHEPQRYTGGGMALAGIILGFVHCFAWIFYLVAFVMLGLFAATVK